MKCKCKERTHDEYGRGTTLWHRAYRNWYDHDRAGNRVRAALWGFWADRIVRWA